MNMFEQAGVFPSINAKCEVIKWQPQATPLTIIQKLLCGYDTAKSVVEGTFEVRII